MGDDPFSFFFAVVMGLIGLVVLINLIWPVGYVPDDQFGVETVGNRRSRVITMQGRRGVQPRLLASGARYFRWRRHVVPHDMVVIPRGSIGVVTSHVGIASAGLTAPYDPLFGVFTDVEAFHAAGGRQGVQEAVLPPGTYAIHPLAFEVIVIDNNDETYTVFGQQSPATDQMAKAEPNVISTPRGAAVAIYPDSDDNHPTLATLQVGAVDRAHCLVVKFLTSPVSTVTIEWEIASPMGSAQDNEAIVSALAALAREEFDTFTHWSVAEFVAKIHAIEAKAFTNHVARITEAVMLPKLAAPVK